jgi:hypothetical protein
MQRSRYINCSHYSTSANTGLTFTLTYHALNKGIQNKSTTSGSNSSSEGAFLPDQVYFIHIKMHHLQHLHGMLANVPPLCLGAIVLCVFLSRS